MTPIVRALRDRIVERVVDAEHPNHKRERYEIAGPAGRFRVQLSHYRTDRSAKRWRVSIFEEMKAEAECLATSSTHSAR